MNAELDGKVVVITGASGGIGSAIARKFAAEGARLVLHCRKNRAQAEALGRELAHIEALVVQAEWTRESETSRLFVAALKRFGRVDTLVANAGAWESRSVA